ncbi:MAG: amino acid dehydrogenase, partial [Bacteroidota bacterium]|nr:amino acid dehydrogenase [Bacteroidota bacterium]
DMLSFVAVNQKIWDIEAEIFIPCAASRLITKDQIDRMISTGIEVIAPGANVPFADPEIFFGPIADYTDSKTSVIPDFISNCGMARVFGYLMGNDIGVIEDEAIFDDTSNTIKNALRNVYKHNSSKTRISKSAFEIALKQLI